VAERLPPGTKVEVRTSFDRSWSRGFEVAEGDGHCYRVRRLSDGVLLPVPVAAADVRRERSASWWWV
jgi:hypothetical protein